MFGFDEAARAFGIEPIGPVVKVKLSPGAVMPRVAKAGDAGADICALTMYDPATGQHFDLSPEGVELCEGQPLVFGTGVALELPAGYRCTVWSRSGLSARNGVEVGAGLIDNGYRGELCVVLENHNGFRPIRVKRGDRIAQICIERYEAPRFALVEELSETERGHTGLGSTGVSSDA